MGRVEGEGKNKHGHVTALAVGAAYRRLGIATSLMAYFEAECDRQSESSHGAPLYYVDLFVRPSNEVAVEMYRRFGYVVYRRILGYYASAGHPEDGFGACAIYNLQICASRSKPTATSRRWFRSIDRCMFQRSANRPSLLFFLTQQALHINNQSIACSRVASKDAPGRHACLTFSRRSSS